MYLVILNGGAKLRTTEVYKDILDKSFVEIQEVYSQFVEINSIRRVIVLSNNPNLHSIFDNSDVVVYFDMIDETALPLLLVERVEAADVDKDALLELVRSINNDESFGYTFDLRVRGDNRYIDIVALRSDIWDRLVGDDGVVSDEEISEVVNQ